MAHQDLLNFKDLLQYIQFRKAKTVLFSKARRIIITAERPWDMLLITSAGSEYVNLNKRTNTEGLMLRDFVNHELKKKYTENQQISIGPSKVDHLVKLRPYLSVPGRLWVSEVENGQRTAGPRPRTDEPHFQPPEPEEEPEDILVSDNFADDYTDMPPPNLPPGYVDNATEEDPPPTQSEPSNSSSEP